MHAVMFCHPCRQSVSVLSDKGFVLLLYGSKWSICLHPLIFLSPEPDKNSDCFVFILTDIPGKKVKESL